MNIEVSSGNKVSMKSNVNTIDHHKEEDQTKYEKINLQITWTLRLIASKKILLLLLLRSKVKFEHDTV